MTQNPNQLGDSLIFTPSFPSHIFMYGYYMCFSFCYVFGGLIVFKQSVKYSVVSLHYYSVWNTFPKKVFKKGNY